MLANAHISSIVKPSVMSTKTGDRTTPWEKWCYERSTSFFRLTPPIAEKSLDVWPLIVPGLANITLDPPALHPHVSNHEVQSYVIPQCVFDLQSKISLRVTQYTNLTCKSIRACNSAEYLDNTSKSSSPTV